jgi:hypothetical protein
MIILIAAGIGSCMSMFGGSGNAIIATSYTAEDKDIIAVNTDYTALQAELAAQINNIPAAYPGYDEYNYFLDPITHEPFELASYLTALFYAYTQEEVQGTLAAILSQQYTLIITPVTEVRYKTEPHWGSYIDWQGNVQYYTYNVEVPYNYYILNVTLINHSIGAVALSNLTPEQYEMYLVLMETQGNKPELFS